MDDTLGKKLAALRREQGLSQKELAKRLGGLGVEVSNQAVSKWEKGLTQPSAGQFLALCRALEIDDISSEFIGGRHGLLRGLNASGVKKVMEYADILRASGLFSDAEIHAKRRLLPLYSMAVSAGTGQFLDSSDYTAVEVGSDVPPSADFGVRVAGNSMEPRYSDGQIVWIHSQQSLSSGETGIFVYDNNVYLKQLISDDKGVLLHSLNPDYPDIEIKPFAELHVLGKAVT